MGAEICSASATSAWAKLASRWYAIELGRDSEQVEEMKRMVADPQQHQSWATREPAEVGLPDQRTAT